MSRDAANITAPVKVNWWDEPISMDNLPVSMDIEAMHIEYRDALLSERGKELYRNHERGLANTDAPSHAR